MKVKRLSLIYVILAACMWGTTGASIRILSQFHFSSIQMVVAKLFMADIFLVGFLFVTDRKKLKIEKKDIKWFLGTGILSMLFFNICYSITVQQTSLSIAAVLLYTSPVFVMLLSIPIFREKITKYKLVAIVLSVAGCAFVSGIFSSDIGQITKKGLGFGVCAAIGYAFYSIFARILLKKYHSLTIISYTFLIASVGGIFIGNVHGIVEICVKEPIAIGAIIGSALICSVLPYILYTKALIDLEASRASVIASIEPVVATIIGVSVFSEKITVSAVFGSACVLAAIGILNVKQN
jgi:drug/metabolite transporter (DMT)-like permease